MRVIVAAATTLAGLTTLTALVSLSSGSLAASAATPASHELYLDFDGETTGTTPNLDNSGSASLTTAVAAAGGGTVVAVRREGAGRAALLEPFDPETPAELAVVVVEPSGTRDPLAPGTGAFTFGAAFRLDEKSSGSSVDDGNNVVQRGLFGDDQYKIQIDQRRLSCRVAGSAGSVMVAADSALDAERWHRARCTRVDGTLTLVLVERTADGTEKHTWTRSGTIGALSFDDAPPLSVGGKVSDDGDVVRSSSDQFNGRIDNVFFRRTDG